MANNANSKKTITGLPENTEAALTYLFGWVSGLVFLLLEKENKKIKFHAMQSLITFGGIHILMIILSAILFPLFFVLGGIISILIPISGLLAFVLWLILIVKTYQGEQFEVPFVGEFVKKQIK